MIEVNSYSQDITIYYDGFYIFEYNTSLVGGNGTIYDANHIDKTYARVDGGTDNPGYLTLKTN